MKKIVTAGEIVVEIMARDRGQTFEGPGPLLGPYASGAPAIFIDQVGRLGQPAAIIASVGEDDFGRLNIRRLQASGVDVSAIAVHPGEATGSAFVRYGADGGRDFVFNIANSACRLIGMDAPAKKIVAEAGHFHVMGSSLFSAAVVEIVLSGIEAVKARGGTVSFDPNIRKEMLGSPGMRAALDAILARCDVFLPSGDELFLFSGADGEDAAARDLLNRGLQAVVVKKGANGASYHGSAGRIDVPAYPADEVDPTGAGDCFGAAFVTQWLRGAAPVEALRWAAAAGAFAVSKRGPMEGTATAEAIAQRVASTGAKGRRA